MEIKTHFYFMPFKMDFPFQSQSGTGEKSGDNIQRIRLG